MRERDPLTGVQALHQFAALEDLAVDAQGIGCRLALVEDFMQDNATNKSARLLALEPTAMLKRRLAGPRFEEGDLSSVSSGASRALRRNRVPGLRAATSMKDGVATSFKKIVGYGRGLGGLDTLGNVMPGIVHDLADGVRLHQLRRIGREHRLNFGQGSVRVQPVRIAVVRDDHRHSVVERCDDPIRFGGDECEALDRRSVTVPAFPQAGECKGLAAMQAEVMGDLLLAFVFPLEKAIG